MHAPRCRNSHHHSIFCILPPHVLREMARRGNTTQRNIALKTLALDGTHRTQRIVRQLLAVAPHITPAGAAPVVHRSIFNCGNEGPPRVSWFVPRVSRRSAMSP
jgi:hypothetical protein